MREQGQSPRVDLGDPWRGAHRLVPDRYLQRLMKVFVDEVLQPPPGTRVIGFKEVRYFDYLDKLPDRLELLHRALSPAVVVFCKRDPVAVSNSAWWKRYPPSTIITEVQRFDVIAEAFVARHQKTSVIADYDSYMNDLEKLRPLFDVLGEAFDAELIRRILEVRLTH
jgi:hypothetical protein